MSKKKFFETTVGKVLKAAASTVAPGLVKSLEGVSNVTEAFGIIKNSEIPVDDKIKLYESIAETQQVEEQEVTKRSIADVMSDSWASKNIRPLSYTFFIGLFSFAMIADSFTKIPFHITDTQLGVIQNVLMTMTGFYFGGRSLEKIISAYKDVR